jgi:hypothetical protein
MSVMTRSGRSSRAAPSALRLSVTASGWWPCARQQVAEQLDVQRIVLDDQNLGQAAFPQTRDTALAPMRGNPNDPVALALAALAATLGGDRRAQRFLDLTGIGTDELRQRAGEPELLAALLRFLEAHEPDLIEVADALGVKPEQLVEARRTLEEGRA